MTIWKFSLLVLVAFTLKRSFAQLIQDYSATAMESVLEGATLAVSHYPQQVTDNFHTSKPNRHENTSESFVMTELEDIPTMACIPTCFKQDRYGNNWSNCENELHCSNLIKNSTGYAYWNCDPAAELATPNVTQCSSPWLLRMKNESENAINNIVSNFKFNFSFSFSVLTRPALLNYRQPLSTWLRNYYKDAAISHFRNQTQGFTGLK